MLSKIYEAPTPEMGIHLVLDSGSSELSKATKAWLADHPFHVRRIPKHTTWLHQVKVVPHADLLAGLSGVVAVVRCRLATGG